MSLATSRSRRANAGANMSKLLDKEEEMMANVEDEVYKTAYGGFAEAENDSDFSDVDSDDSENVIDSDFDIDETQGIPADDDDANERAALAEEKETRRAEKRAANVYKDPKARNLKPTLKKRKPNLPAKSASSIASSRPAPRRKVAIVPAIAQVDDENDPQTINSNNNNNGYSKNLRKSTQKSSKEIREMIDERNRIKKRKARKQANNRRKASDYRPLTQAQMLREAKKTERENAKSLEAYKNMEIEKTKKVKSSKPARHANMIRYYSYTEVDENKPVDGSENRSALETFDPRKHERKVIVFPSDESFRANFPWHKPADERDPLLDSMFVEPIRARTSDGTENDDNNNKNNNQNNNNNNDKNKSENLDILTRRKNGNTSRSICPITKKPAKYFDPLTSTPYATPFAFLAIRSTYMKFLELYYRDDSRVQAFLAQNKISDALTQPKAHFTVPVKRSIVKPNHNVALRMPNAKSAEPTVAPTPTPTVTSTVVTPTITAAATITATSITAARPAPGNSRVQIRTYMLPQPALNITGPIGTHTRINTPMIAFPAHLSARFPTKQIFITTSAAAAAAAAAANTNVLQQHQQQPQQQQQQQQAIQIPRFQSINAAQFQLLQQQAQQLHHQAQQQHQQQQQPVASAASGPILISAHQVHQMQQQQQQQQQQQLQVSSGLMTASVPIVTTVSATSGASTASVQPSSQNK